MKVTIIPNESGVLLQSVKDFKGTGGHRSKRASGDHPKKYIIENGQNTAMSPGDLRRPAVSQTSVKEPQVTLMRKTLKE